MNRERFLFLLRKFAAWGLIFLAVTTLVTEAKATRDVWNSFQAFGGVDDVTRWENRLAELRTHIPSGVDRIGYLASDPEHIEFYLTQYIVIPAVLERGIAPDWIIVNYQGKSIQLVLKKQLDLDKYAVENFGYGLYLVHRR
jgi:hypothetical protein